MSIVVVTGTNTDVGKTVVTAAVATLAATRGTSVAVVKPAQTGVTADGPGDLATVRQLAGVTDLHEYVRYPDPLSPAAAARLTIPWLIIHGDADTSVPVDEGRRLFDAAGDTTELLVVEGGDHGFGGKHPYTGATPELRMVAEATLDWFDTHLE